jgi:AcrR family transcriptional regulator
MKYSDSQDTANKIIDVALELFVKKGFHGTSISDITRAAKLSKGAIYFHFKNKDSLFKEILKKYETIYMDKMIELAESKKGKSIDKFLELFKFSLNFSAENRDICLCLTILATELCSNNKKYERIIMKVYRKYYDFLGNLFRKGIEDGSFRGDYDPSILALIFIGANDGNLLQWNMNLNNNVKNFSHNFSKNYMKFVLNAFCRDKQTPE